MDCDLEHKPEAEAGEGRAEMKKAWGEAGVPAKADPVGWAVQFSAQIAGALRLSLQGQGWRSKPYGRARHS